MWGIIRFCYLIKFFLVLIWKKNYIKVKSRLRNCFSFFKFIVKYKNYIKRYGNKVLNRVIILVSLDKD